MTTFSLKDYYDNLGVTAPKEEDEYSGGIPIPFLGWAKINEEVDREDREMMLREQMNLVNEELNEAREIIAKQSQMLDLFQRFIRDQELHGKWMFFIQDRKNV